MSSVDIAEVHDAKRTSRIWVEPTKWGRPYSELHEQADAGYVTWRLYSHNNFNNPFHARDLQRYGERGYCAEIFHDLVEHREPDRGEVSPGEGYVPITCAVLSGTPDEMRIKTWVPRIGHPVPEKDTEGRIIFFRDKYTLIPIRTIPFENRSEVEKIFRQFGLPTGEVFGFWKPDDYRNNSRFVGRHFCPADPDCGGFGVHADGLPYFLGISWIASRPRYEQTEPEPQILLSVDEQEPVR